MPLLVSALVALLLIGRVVTGVRDWQQQSEDLAAPAFVPASATAAMVTDLAAVQNLHLFSGQAANGAVARAADSASVATTDLNLSLEGVILSNDPSRSMAIIVSGGKQASYRPGDGLPTGGAVSVREVLADHVILDNNGAAESLWLYDSNKPVVSGAAVQPGTDAGAVLGRLRQQAVQNPAVAAATLSEILTITPAQQNGQLVGYRLSPGNRLKDFMQLGFRENDVVTAVNGIALSDAGNLPQLYGLMNSAGDVSFSLLREGQPVTLQVTLAP